MKNKIIMIMFGMIFLFLIMQTCLSEIYLWDNTIKDVNNSIVNYHAYYQYEDTSTTGVGANQDTRIVLWYTVQALPLNLTDSNFNLIGQVDWCNFTIRDNKNIFDSLGNIVNTTTEISNYYFTTGGLNSSQLVFLMRNRDSITADMKCHYTTPQSLYFENILAGNFATYMSSYQCVKCVDFSLEELSNMAQKNLNISANELSVYGSIQKVVDFNYQGWLIASWIIKIGMIFIAVALIFAGVYYFYVFFSNIGKELER